MVYNAKSDISGTISQFTRRKSIFINSGVTLSAYQTKLTISYESTMQTDFRDIRFNDASGNYCPYWIESKTDSSTATVWIKTDLVSGSNTAYMYYGNSFLTSGSDGNNTFEFFDDFNSWDHAKWERYGTGTDASITVSNSIMRIDGTNLQTIRTFSPGVILSVMNKKGTRQNCGTSFSGANFNFHEFVGNNAVLLRPLYFSASNTISYTQDSFNTDWTVYKKKTITWASGLAKADVEGVTDTITTYVPTASLRLILGEYDAGSINEMYIDWLFVRKYTATEPITCIGGEEVSIPSWLANWNRRKLITITGSISGIQTDYQMKLTVHKSSGTDTSTNIYLGSNVNNDFSDLRFTTSDGSTLINYWIESYISATSAIVWIKIPSIPTSPCITTIYTYYNNSGASTLSNGTNTFIFYDNNEAYSNGTSLTTAGWTIPSGTYVFSNVRPFTGTISISGLDTGSGIYHTVGGVNTPRIIEADVWDVKGSVDNYSFIYGGIGSTAKGGFGYYDIASTTSYLAVTGVYTGLAGVTSRSQGWIKARIDVKDSSGTVDYWVNGVKSTTSSTGSLLTTSFDTIFLRAGNATVYWDNVRIRKYTSSEPTFSSIGTEEQSTGDLNISTTPSGSVGASVYIDGNVTPSGVTPLIVTGFVPGTHNYRLTKSGYTEIPATNFSITAGQTTTISQNMLTVANITASNMTITPSDTPCVAGSCIVTIVVRWSNSGETNGSVIPNIKIDNVSQSAHSSRNIIADSYIDEIFAISDLTTGTHTICPDPN